MWRAGVDKVQVSEEEDEWETDPNFENNVSEKEQRWGSKTIQGSGRVEGVKIDAIRQAVAVEDKKVKEASRTENFSAGYGGKFGVQADRMDRSAVGLDYQAEKAVHSSQVDMKKGFGGKYGVVPQNDKAALGFDAVTKTETHSSVSDGKKAYGGKFGVADKTDKNALGFDEPQRTAPAAAPKPSAPAGAASKITSRFENVQKEKEEEAARVAAEQKAAREKLAEAERERERQRIEAQRAKEAAARTAAAPAKAPAAPAAVPPPPARQPEPEPEKDEWAEEPEAEAQAEEPEVEAQPEAAPEAEVQAEEPAPAQDEWAQEEQAYEQQQQEEQAYEQQQEEQQPVAGGSGLTATALYDYQAQEENELDFDPGEVIENIEQLDEGWWMGDCRGKRGLFPANYVQLNE